MNNPETTPILPSGWTPDPTLQRDLPPELDYTTFIRARQNLSRYAVSITGQGVWNIEDHCWVVPSIEKGCRRRYRLNQGRGNKPIRIYYGHLVAQLVLGPPPRPDMEAHHGDLGPGVDHWQNLRWQSGKQNRAIETEKRRGKQRMGTANGRTKISDEMAQGFLLQYAEDKRLGCLAPWKEYAFAYGASARQLQNILKGRSRQNLTSPTA